MSVTRLLIAVMRGLWAPFGLLLRSLGFHGGRKQQSTWQPPADDPRELWRAVERRRLTTDQARAALWQGIERRRQASPQGRDATPQAKDVWATIQGIRADHEQQAADASASSTEANPSHSVFGVLAGSRGRTVIRVAAGLAVATGALMAALFAFSDFSSTSSGQSNSVNAAVLPQGNTPSASVTPANSSTATITFSTVSVGGTQLTSYTLNRYDANSSAETTDVGSCGAPSGGTVTCTDIPGNGMWKYTDTPTFNSWVGTESGKSNAVTVDTTTPSVSIGYPVNNATYGSNWGGSITGSASDSISGVSSVAVSLQQGSGSNSCWTGSAATFTASCPNYVPVTSGTTSWSLTVATSVLTSGDSYHVTAQATNGVGTTGTSPTVTFTYNTSPPTVAVTYPANNTTYGADWTGIITGTASPVVGTVSSTAVAIKNTTTGFWWNGSSFSAGSQTFEAASGTTSWTYALAASLVSGDSYSVTGQATDSLGNVGTSSPVTFTYSTAPPLVSASYPVNNATYGADWTPAITGSASASNGASVSSVGVSLQQGSGECWTGSGATFTAACPNYVPVTSGTTSWSLNVAASVLTSGDSYHVTAQATDSAGNVGTTGSTVTFTYNTSQPSVAITYPAASTVYGADWTSPISGTAASNSGAGLSTVAISIQQGSGDCWNGGSGGSSAFNQPCPSYVQSTGTTSWSQAFTASQFPANGTYTVTALATDNAGNTATTSNTFTYNTTQPTVSVTYPVSGTTYGTSWSGTITGNASSNAGGGTSITSAAVAIEDTNTNEWWNGSSFSNPSQTFVAASGTSSWSYALAAGKLTSGHSYTVTGKATDSAGNSNTGSTVTFTYNTSQPAVTVTYPVSGTLYGTNWGGTITGTASSNAGAGTSITSTAVAIKNTTTGFWWNGTSFGASSLTFVPASGTTGWSLSFAASNLTSGDSYDVIGEATDSAGNVGSSSTATFTYDTSQPTVTVGYPSNNTTYGTNWAGTITGTASPTSGGTLTSVAVSLQQGSGSSSCWTGSGSTFTASCPHYVAVTSGMASWSLTVASSVLISGDNYNVIAQATDSLQNVGTSSTVTFTYSTAVPTDTVTFPSASSYTSSTWTGAITGTSSANAPSTTISTATVAIENITTSTWWNGSSFAAGTQTFVPVTTGTTNWSLTFSSANLTVGDSYTVVGKATDSAGNSGTSTTASFSYASAGVGSGTTVVGAGPSGSDYAVAMCPAGEVAVGGGYYTGEETMPPAPHTYIDGPVTGATLASAVSGISVSSLSLTASGLPFAVSSGDILYVGTPGNLDSFKVTTSAGTGATSVVVGSDTNLSGSPAIPAGSYVFDITSSAWEPPSSGSGAETTTSDGWYILNDFATPTAYVTCASATVSPVTLYETGVNVMGDEAGAICPSGDTALSGGGYGGAVSGAVHTYIDGPVTSASLAMLSTAISGGSVTTLTLSSPGLPFAISNGDILLVGSPGDVDTFTVNNGGGYSAGATSIKVNVQSGSASIPAGSYVYDLTASAWRPPTLTTAATSPATSEGWYILTDTPTPTAYVICAASTNVTIATSYETGISTGMGMSAMGIAAVMCPAGDVAIGGGDYGGAEMGAVHTYFNAPVTAATLASSATTSSTTLLIGSGGLPFAVASGDTLIVGTPGNLDSFTASAASTGATTVSVSGGTNVSGSSTIPSGSYVFDLTSSNWRPPTSTSTSASVPDGWYVLTDTGTPSAYVTCSPTTPTAPTITSGTSTTFTVGTPGSFQVTASGNPAPTFSYTGSLPTGVTLSASGLLSGTPAAGTVNSYPITITATNTGGNSPGQSFTLTVQKASPTITVSAPATGTPGTSISAASFGATIASSSGTSGETGTITFTVFGPQSTAPTPCTSGGTTVGTATANGNGTYTASGAGLSSPTAGDYWVYASVPSDANDDGAVSTCGSGMTEIVVTPSVIIYEGVGTVETTTANNTTFSVPYPTNAESGDLLLLIASNSHEETITSCPSGWTSGTSVTTTTGVHASLSLCYKFDAGETSVSVTSPGNAGMGFSVRVAAFRNVDATTPFDVADVTSVGTAGSTTFTPTGVANTVTANDMAVSIVMQNDDSSTIPTLNFTGSGGNARGFTPEFTNGVSTSTSNAAALANQSIPSASTAVTFPTWTSNTAVSGNSPWLGISLALRPVSPSAPTITSASSTTFAPSTSGSFTVTTSGYPTPAITTGSEGSCTQSALPGTVSITDNGNGTATIAGNPGATLTSYTFCLTASNGVSPNATQTFTLVVSSTPPGELVYKATGTPTTWTGCTTASPCPAASVNYPTGTQSGDLLILVIEGNTEPGPPMDPTGWTKAPGDFGGGPGSDPGLHVAVYYKLAGSETSVSVTPWAPDGGHSSYVASDAAWVIRYEQASGTPAAAGTVADNYQRTAITTLSPTTIVTTAAGATEITIAVQPTSTLLTLTTPAGFSLENSTSMSVTGDSLGIADQYFSATQGTAPSAPQWTGANNYWAWWTLAFT